MRHLLRLPVHLAVVAFARSGAQQPAPILLQGAMQLEVKRLIDSVHVTRIDSIGPWTFAHGTVDGLPVIVSRTLMGGTNAAAATAFAIERYHPRAIINTGTAGGYDSTLRNGDIVIGVSATSLGAFRSPPRLANAGSAPADWVPLDLVPRPGDRDGDMHVGSVTDLPADSALLAAAHRARAAVPTMRITDGIIGSADFWNQELDRIALFHQRWHTAVEDMETAPAAQVARAFGIPFLGVRVVSDNAITGAKFDRVTADVVQDFVIRVVHEYRGVAQASSKPPR
jgi:adenosylhomocysteine nucleosidase